MKRIAILTSGGDAPGMNAAIRSAVRSALNRGMEAYGIYRGYEGLLDGDMKEMNWASMGDILHRGGTILKTARSNRFMELKWQEHAVQMLETFGIEGLIICGGDGTHKGGLDLDKLGFRVMAVPVTIDNDLGYTDYTIGFDTAVNTILELISKIRDTSSAHERTTIVEVMGRNCGDLALHSGLSGGADVIMVPEIPVDINEVCRKVLRGQSTGKNHSLIVKAEGVSHLSGGDPISAEELAVIMEERTGREARCVVPGYIQRGGNPTGRDRMIASLTAEKAVDLLYNDYESRAIGMSGDELITVPLAEATEMKKEINENIYKLAEIMAGGM